MRKIIFGIFAHPDDEAFGPCGTLLTEVENGTELHLITLTSGGAGMNPDGHEDLASHRLVEWRRASKLIGATSIDYLGYADGQLNNRSMIEIGERLIDKITSFLKSHPDDIEVEFITLDLNGCTGHIDHIVAARSSCYAFYEIKKTDPRLKRLRLSCLPASVFPATSTQWIFMEPGRSPDEIDETVDARRFNDKIHAIMQVHHSQREDYANVLKYYGDDIGINYFIVKS